MALSTKTIQDTIEWAKRLSFNRNPVIGNSLEPALSSATMVMQTIMSPPFDWWWNNKELVFTCDPNPLSAIITNVAITSNVGTILAVNTFAVGEVVTLSGLTTATFLEDQIIRIDTVSPTQFTFEFRHPDYTSAADTGTAEDITTQDYTIPTPEFSHIEHASIAEVDPTTGVPTKWHDLTVRNNLALDNTSSRPQFVGPHVQDADGNTTFRVLPSPDKKYPVSIHIQKAAPEVTSMNQTWAPIPDFMSYIYNWGFMALMWHFADDPRAMYANDKFVSGILARAEGLTEEERNIFLNNWNNLMSGSPMGAQMGTAARAK